MAGHSKFKNIMHRKGAQDAKRGKIFTKLIREITVAAKQGGADVTANPRLRAAIAAANAENMPKDNVERAIKKATDAGNSDDYSDIRYEGYGPNGIAFIVEALTDNRNRTASEIRTAFNKHGGSLGETGSVAFMFDHIGEITYPADKADADAMFEAGVEAGADNVESDDGQHTITTANDSLHSVREQLEEKFGDPSSCKLVWQPQNTIALDADGASTVLKLYSALDDSDDVQNVYANFEIDEAILAEMA